MNLKATRKQVDTSELASNRGTGLVSRTMLRRVFGALGAVGGIIVLSGLDRGILVVTASGIAIFLAVTNFGRQCPLILSLRHILYRWKSRRVPPVL